jgi:16S rRNA (uracil1498-N3)-methyltransferase
MDARRSRDPRLYLEHRLDVGTVRLEEREAHYLKNVLRLQRGDAVVVFNGRGEERQASLTRLTRRDAELTIADSVPSLAEPKLEIILLQALIRSEPMDTVVQKATELGVRRIVPVLTEFSVVRLADERAEQRVRHWEKVARSACEQSGRHRPTTIAPPTRLDAWLGDRPGEALRLVMEPRSRRSLASLAPTRQPESVELLCGPEGGFSGTELDAIEAAGFEQVSIGPRTLRAETAALVGCAIVQARWGDLGS